MIVTAYFSENGSPKTGLSPTVDIIDLFDDSVVVNDGVMTEVGQGWYKYVFAGYDNAKDYATLCDSVTLVGSERYAVGSIGGGSDWGATEREQIRDALGIDGAKTKSVGGVMQRIKSIVDAILAAVS